MFWVQTSPGVIFIWIQIRLNTTWAIFIHISTSWIFQKILNIYLHRPEAFLDFHPIFICTGLRDLVELSGVLKNDMKNGYCECSEMQTSWKWSKNAFYLPLAVLGTFKLHLKGLGKIIIVLSSLPKLTIGIFLSPWTLNNMSYMRINIFLYTTYVQK